MKYKLSTIRHFSQVTLSDEERAYLRGRMAQVVSSPITAGDSLPLFQRGMHHGLRIALSSFLLVIFAGGSISAIASNALPGDPLYVVKTDINEEIKAALLKSPEEKVAFAKNRVEKRVGEIKTLAETKTLTKEKQAKVQKALDANIKDLSEGLSSLSEKSPASALTVTSTLEESLKEGKAALQDTDEELSEDTTASLEAIDGTLKKVSEQEVHILSKQLDQITSDVETTPTGVSVSEHAEEEEHSTVPLPDEASLAPEEHTVQP